MAAKHPLVPAVTIFGRTNGDTTDVVLRRRRLELRTAVLRPLHVQESSGMVRRERRDRTIIPATDAKANKILLGIER